jgi:hypothetical protein
MPPEPAWLTPAWRSWGRWLAAIAAAAFAVAALLALLDSLNLTATPPSIPSDAQLPDRILAILQNQSQRIPVIFVSSVVAIVAYAAFAALGPVLRRSFAAASEPRGSLLVGALALGGAVGVTGELLYIGGQAVASDATYCECAFRDPQLIARGGVLDLVGSMQSWATWGLVTAFAIGLLATAGLAAGSPGVPRGWTVLTRVLAALMLVVAVLGAGFPLVAQSLYWDVDPQLVTGVPSLAVLLVLIPWWSLWLRSWLGTAANTLAEGEPPAE